MFFGGVLIVLTLKISYKPLFKLMIDKEITNRQLRERAKLSSSTFYKLKNNDNVTTETLLKICCVLECNISDIIECIKE